MSQDVTAKMLKPDFDMEVSGLVYGYLFHEDHPPQPIASGEVCASYQALADDKAFIWLHLNLNHEMCIRDRGFHAGWRKSGIGGADGRHGLNEYLQTQVVYLQA